LKNLQIVYFATYSNILGYCCQRNAYFVTIAVKWSNFFLCRMGKAFCERPLTLHPQQPEKFKQNFNVAPMEKFLRTPMERGLGAILTNVCRSRQYAILLNGASASWG